MEEIVSDDFFEYQLDLPTLYELRFVNTRLNALWVKRFHREYDMLFKKNDLKYFANSKITTTDYVMYIIHNITVCGKLGKLTTPFVIDGEFSYLLHKMITIITVPDTTFCLFMNKINSYKFISGKVLMFCYANRLITKRLFDRLRLKYIKS